MSYETSKSLSLFLPVLTTNTGLGTELIHFLIDYQKLRSENGLSPFNTYIKNLEQYGSSYLVLFNDIEKMKSLVEKQDEWRNDSDLQEKIAGIFDDDKGDCGIWPRVDFMASELPF